MGVGLRLVWGSEGVFFDCEVEGAVLSDAGLRVLSCFGCFRVSAQNLRP